MMLVYKVCLFYRFLTIKMVTGDVFVEFSEWIFKATCLYNLNFA